MVLDRKLRVYESCLRFRINSNACSLFVNHSRLPPQSQQRAIAAGRRGSHVETVGDTGGGAAPRPPQGLRHPQGPGRRHPDGLPHRHRHRLHAGRRETPQRPPQVPAREETHPPAHQDAGRPTSCSRPCQVTSGVKRGNPRCYSKPLELSLLACLFVVAH